MVIRRFAMFINLGKEQKIGCSDFEKFIKEKFWFADKSLLINEVCKRGHVVRLILRPRRFGKSLNLHMLKYFFDVSNREETNDRRELFNGLKIMREFPNLFHPEKGHFCKHPVIYLNFQDITTDSWELFASSVRDLIAELYEDRRYLLDSLNESQQSRYRATMSHKLPIHELTRSLGVLSKYLSQYHHSNCVVLIDEYDAPLERAFNCGFYNEARAFFLLWLSNLLKGNDANLFKVVMVGVLPVSNSEVVSGLNNIQEEVKLLIEHYRPEINLKRVEEWYDGYRTVNNEPLYNPVSIAELCQTGKFKNYWVMTGNSTSLKVKIWNASSSFKKHVENLLQWKKLDIVISNSLYYDNIKDKDHPGDASLWTLLLYAGYLKYIGITNSKELDLKSDSNLSRNKFKFEIPNGEILQEWKSWMTPSGNADVNSMLGKLLNIDLKGFDNEFAIFVVQCFSYVDVGSTKSNSNVVDSTRVADFVYFGFLMGLLISAENHGYRMSNNESRLGGFDIALEPVNPSKFALIFELNSGNGIDTPEKASKDAMAQILEKQYKEGLLSSVQGVIEVGIGLKGEKCHLRFEFYEKDYSKWKVVDTLAHLL